MRKPLNFEFIEISIILHTCELEFVIYFNKLIQSNETKWATSKKLIIMSLLLLKYCHFGLHFVHIGYFQCLKHFLC
jgi:hypothetical protein